MGDEWAVGATFLEASFKDPEANWGWSTLDCRNWSVFNRH
jgi:hypothetical protein